MLISVVFTMPLRRRITVIIVSILQSMKLRLRKAEPFAQSDLQSWDRSPGAAGAISEMGIGFGAANNTQRKSGMMITSIARQENTLLIANRRIFRR